MATGWKFVVHLLSKNFTVYGFTRSKEKSNLKNLIKLKILKKLILFKFTQLNLKFVEKTTRLFTENMEIGKKKY